MSWESTHAIPHGHCEIARMSFVGSPLFENRLPVSDFFAEMQYSSKEV